MLHKIYLIAISGLVVGLSLQPASVVSARSHVVMSPQDNQLYPNNWFSKEYGPDSILGLQQNDYTNYNQPVNAQQSLTSIANDGIKLVNGQTYYYPGTKGFVDRFYRNGHYVGMSQQSRSNHPQWENHYWQAVKNPGSQYLTPETVAMFEEQDVQYQRTNLQPRIWLDFDASNTFDNRYETNDPSDVTRAVQLDMQNFAYSQVDGLTGLDDNDYPGVSDYYQRNHNGILIYIYYGKLAKTQMQVVLDQDLKNVIPQTKVDALVHTYHHDLMSHNKNKLSYGLTQLNLGLTKLLWQYRIQTAIQQPVTHMSMGNRISRWIEPIMMIIFFGGGTFLIYKRMHVSRKLKFKS